MRQCLDLAMDKHWFTVNWFLVLHLSLVHHETMKSHLIPLNIGVPVGRCQQCLQCRLATAGWHVAPIINN